MAVNDQIVHYIISFKSTLSERLMKLKGKFVVVDKLTQFRYALKIYTIIWFRDPDFEQKGVFSSGNSMKVDLFTRSWFTD